MEHPNYVTQLKIGVDIFVDFFDSCAYSVSSQQQYEFIYDTVAMHLHCGITVINVGQLPFMVQKLSLKNPQTRQSGFEKEFKVRMTNMILFNKFYVVSGVSRVGLKGGFRSQM